VDHSPHNAGASRTIKRKKARPGANSQACKAEFSGPTTKTIQLAKKPEKKKKKPLTSYGGKKGTDGNFFGDRAKKVRKKSKGGKKTFLGILCHPVGGKKNAIEGRKWHTTKNFKNCRKRGLRKQK